MTTKQLTRVEIKSKDEGTVRAVFATLGVKADLIDSDGDVTQHGAFTDGAPVVISAYGHKSWDGALPLGMGTIHEDGDEAIFEGKFLLDTQHGADAFRTVKALSEAGLQEWSYSLHNVVAERTKLDGRDARVLKKIDVHEVSPVLKGAGVRTRTLEAKSRKQLDSSIRRLLHRAGRERWPAGYSWVADYDVDAGFVVYELYAGGVDRLVQVAFSRTDTSVELGSDETEVHETALFLPKALRFTEHIESVLADVDGLASRAAEVVALRAEKGKAISEGNEALLKRLDQAMAALKGALTAPPPASPDDATAEWLRFVALSQGVTR